MKINFRLMNNRIIFLLIIATASTLVFYFFYNHNKENKNIYYITEKTIEEKIFKILPNEFKENGYSKSGFLDGDCNIYFKDNNLNVTYLINGTQITEKGIITDYKLITNIEGTKIINGKWNNNDAGDGIVVIQLKEKNKVYIQIEGFEGSNWWHKAESTIDSKNYDELYYFFYGYTRKSNPTESKKIENTKQKELTKEIFDNKESKSKINKNIYGSWINNDFNGTLEISKNEALFYGGPFSESLSIKHGNNYIDLYFKNIEAKFPTENSNEIKCKKIVARCYFENNFLFYEGFGDECGQLPKGKFKLETQQ